jgi:hypothetical protein
LFTVKYHGEQTDVGEAEEAEIDRQVEPVSLLRCLPGEQAEEEAEIDRQVELVLRRCLSVRRGCMVTGSRGGGIIIQTVWGWVAPFQNDFVGKVGNGFCGRAARRIKVWVEDRKSVSGVLACAARRFLSASWNCLALLIHEVLTYRPDAAVPLDRGGR